MRIVTLGDSVTKGVREGVLEEEVYAARWQQALRQEGRTIEVIACGVGGENTDAALLRLPEALALRPQIMTIMYGLNDAAVDVGSSGPRVPVERYRENLRQLTAQVRQQDISPVLLTPNPMAAFGVIQEQYAARPPYDTLGLNTILESYIDAVKQIGSEEGIPVVDLYSEFSALAEEPHGLTGYLTDGIHPNPAGHQRIADCLLRHCSSWL